MPIVREKGIHSGVFLASCVEQTSTHRTSVAELYNLHHICTSSASSGHCSVVLPLLFAVIRRMVEQVTMADWPKRGEKRRKEKGKQEKSREDEEHPMSF